ncbi:glycine cleavage system aminomethyltransferase GcvT [Bacillus tuaregi]|uniref:glycine cleavage system aminomethyltransferase GcvT n=1 Tax=Bacillus tuaregi TaxID=1816695 RepID=UPI0008F802F3|nr:glycine cleavage system aminomethyltransferase GcvT [Bacillus tuaregi]
MTELKRTPLYRVYKEYGAKTIDFGGWELPVQFSSIKEEHEAVRTKAGLFDVSHMGEITVRGPGSLSYLQKMMTNDISKIKNGTAQYNAMCYDNGGTVDDLLVYKLAEDDYLLVVNAANTEKDYKWLLEHLDEGVVLENISQHMAQLALQGPLAEKILEPLVPDVKLTEVRPFGIQNQVVVAGKQATLSRTGYTGEDGFEIYCKPEDAEDLWRAILIAGSEYGIRPIGLGARDTLRFEAKLALYGQELSQDITPLEAGIGFAVKLDKEAEFIGKSALKKQKDSGLPRRIVGIEMIDRGIPRHGYRVFVDEKEIGFITTGTQSPTLKRNIGLALLQTEQAVLGNEVFVEIRGKRLKAKIVKTPFYKRVQ